MEPHLPRVLPQRPGERRMRIAPGVAAGLRLRVVPIATNLTHAMTALVSRSDIDDWSTLSGLPSRETAPGYRAGSRRTLRRLDSVRTSESRPQSLPGRLDAESEWPVVRVESGDFVQTNLPADASDREGQRSPCRAPPMYFHSFVDSELPTVARAWMSQ